VTRTLKLTRLWYSALAVAAFALLGASPIAGTTADAQEVPTTGEAAAASGGVAHTVFIGDLKKFATPSGTCGSAFQGYVVCENDYDDDPGADNRFHVAPNPADNPLQHAWKVVVFDFHDQSDTTPPIATSNDIEAIQKEIFWIAPHASTDGPNDQNPPQRVFHEVVEARLSNGNIDPNVILTGSNCNVLGNYGTNGTIADGLVQTGQTDSTSMQNWINECIQGEVGVHLNNWTVSKHLPPGTYRQVITLVHTNGAETDPVSVDFVVEPLSHYVMDFATDGVNWDNLKKDNQSVYSGDWDLNTPFKPTIQGDGNTSLVLRLRYAPLVNAEGKIIWSDFDAQINRRNSTGQLIEWDHEDGIQAAQTDGVFGDWRELDGPNDTAAGITSSGAVCLEPNEPLKLDFSVTPRQTVFSGLYEGAVQLEGRVRPAICSPSFDQGESTTGDPNVFDNNPSQGGPNNPTEAPPTPTP
jgi:hypothetical protein